MGTLYIVSTPIGNLEDITLRALRILKEVDIIACEDTRTTSQLLNLLSTKFAHVHNFSGSAHQPKLIRYDDRTEISKAPEILELLTQGKSVALVSDAGTPLISDPGYVLVREARKRGIPVISVPGASALLTALTSSGLPADKFMFLGYPPEKQSHRFKLFTQIVSIKHLIGLTYIFYCPPHKLLTTLEDMKSVFGDIDVSICRELTKIHEECWSETISKTLAYYQNPKGEFVLMMSLST